MTWFDSIYDLQYYNPTPGIPCYCNTLVFPSDMFLQGAFPKGSGSYTLTLLVYSADGLTAYEDATAYFQYFFAVGQNGQHFFSARLKGYSPAMCSHACFIIRAVVSQGGLDLFDKYTERYCQFTCCDIVRNVSISQDGLMQSTGDTTAGTTPTAPKTSPCGDTFITLRTKYDCYDSFTGEYFGTGWTVLSGTGFEYENISNFKGRVVRRPREITREYSYNCRLQRAESAQTFYLEGFDLFPAWKMNEIEAQLHSTEIYVDDVRYEYNGGTPFEQLSDCFEFFKLSTVLNGCIIRQVYGCDAGCAPQPNFDGGNIMFIIPQSYQVGTASPFQPQDAFYSESGVLVAYDYDGLLEYMRNLNGISGVNDIDISGIGCEPYKAFSITGEGYIPGSFYYSSVQQGNRVLGVVLNSVDEICDYIPVTCSAPVFGSITVEDDTCDAPVFGTITVEDMEITDIAIEGYNDWVKEDAETNASMYNYLVTFDLKVFNENYPNVDSPPQVFGFQGEIIGVIGAAARPLQAVILDETNSNVPADRAIMIMPNGQILFSGEPTLSNGLGSYIELVDISYNTQ